MGEADRRPELGGWQIQGRRRLVDNRWLRVDAEQVLLPNGVVIDDYYVTHEPDWGMVFAVTDTQQVLLVRQYKHGIGQITVELPAGYFESGDTSAEDSIRRELREETGFEADQIIKLASLICGPTRSSQRGHFFLATGCRRVGNQSLDPAERIEVLPVAIDDLLELIRNGTIAVESSVAGIGLGLDALRQPPRQS